MERFLERIAFSKYRDCFIVKGGILVISMIGISLRSTMDVDTTIRNFNLNEEKKYEIITEIKDIKLEDNIEFELLEISNIMDNMDYPGIRIHMNARLERLVVPIKIDISTGDIITPREIKYNFNLMLENRTIEVWAYNLETVLAEKLETVISRNVTNTRMRDFYDIYILQKLYGEQLSKDVLWDALVATAKKRETLEQIETEDIDEVFDEIQSSSVMENLWKAYQRNYSYSADIPWHTIMKSIRTLYEIISENIHGV